MVKTTGILAALVLALGANPSAAQTPTPDPAPVPPPAPAPPRSRSRSPRHRLPLLLPSNARRARPRRNPPRSASPSIARRRHRWKRPDGSLHYTAHVPRRRLRLRPGPPVSRGTVRSLPCRLVRAAPSCPSPCSSSRSSASACSRSPWQRYPRGCSGALSPPFPTIAVRSHGAVLPCSLAWVSGCSRLSHSARRRRFRSHSQRRGSAPGRFESLGVGRLMCASRWSRRSNHRFGGVYGIRTRASAEGRSATVLMIPQTTAPISSARSRK